MWVLANKKTPSITIAEDFSSRGEAEAYLKRLGPTIGNYYCPRADYGNDITNRMLTEGLVKNDLWRILLPRVSVDEFVPGDPETDNVVIAFFLKGVPEATLPFKSFCEQSNGVISADYGDSETVIGAQNVYVEMDRENLDMDDIHALMIQVSMLSGMEPDDFTMTFPHTDKKFPYDPITMREYFISRNEQKNRIAQQRALDKAAQKFEDDLKKARQQKQQQQRQENPEDVQESLADTLANVPLTG